MAAKPSISPAAGATGLDCVRSAFSDGGEMGSLMRSFRWEDTSLGPISSWPQSLRIAAQIILNSRYAMFIWWGPELLNLYNDPYRVFLGVKHPAALGRSARDVWSEIWDQIGPRTDAVLLRGESTFDKALLLMMERHGYVEETYFTFSYSPLPADDDGIGGIFCAVTEETEGVIDERRLTLLREITASMANAHTPGEVCHAAAQRLQEARRDLPFTLIYLLEPDGQALTCAGEAGIDCDHPAAVRSLSWNDREAAWPLREVIETGEPVLVENLRERFPDLPHGEWDQPPDSAVLMPIAQQGQKRPAGVLVASLNPHRRFDAQFRGFVTVLSTQIAGALANANAYEAERRRAEELADLDKAKTTFFSNVSHEFRTPLTLMLGPLEEALTRFGDWLPADGREQLVVARRNALRLLKLVNTLLDFSRIEAGRVQAVYEPVDLAILTAEIASVFRSAIEKAGLRFTVACEEAGEPVYVDREMWEKIVLNLLSNAFKFTFEGEIAVGLRRRGDMVEFSVRDTGIGIAEDELGRIFERFHRIENTRARTHEGTGIGLSLVQELAHLHGGRVTAESRREQGSTFRVTLPLGRDHLPEEHIGVKRTPASATLGIQTWVEEVQRWLPEGSAAAAEQPPISWLRSSSEPPSAADRPTVLLADDNADMRDYVAQLLRQEYKVHAVANGVEAVEEAKRLRPALILTDIMMPKLDGFGVLKAIRDDPSLRSIPVILLSARAGEESRLEGLQAGSDDYLVKPFTARELLARVATHIRMANLRREAAEREARLHAEAETERQRFREILEYSPAAVGLLSGPELRWTFVNDFYVRVTGRRSAEEFLGKKLTEALPELEGQGYLEILDRVYQTGEPYVGLEARVGLRRGPNQQLEDAYFNFVYQPMRAASGEIQGILAHAVDVTDQVTARLAIEANQQKLETALVASQRLAAIVESSDDAIVSKNLKGIVTSWNPAAERIFGYASEEMVGRSILTIIPPELHGDEERILQTIAAGRRIEHFETVRLTKDGRRIDVSLTISPVRNDAGVIVGAAKIARDITKRRQTEQALRMTERLASVGRLAASIAHEINNPLEGLTNLVYLAKQNTAEPNTRDLLRSAEEELARVSLLTRQTLGFYRERASARIFTISSLLTPLMAAYMSRIRNKGITIQPEIRQDPEICGVAGEIRQVIANLLSNSIDAAPPGGRIRVRISSGWNGEQERGVRLTIADTGTGIPPDARKRIYQPFFTTKKDTGTGLGLWVCQGIVEKHGGRISLLSSTVPGRSGTAFSIFLPLDGTKPAQP